MGTNEYTNHVVVDRTGRSTFSYGFKKWHYHNTVYRRGPQDVRSVWVDRDRVSVKKKFWRYQNDHGNTFKVRYQDNNLVYRELDIWNSTTTSNKGAKCIWMESISEISRDNLITNPFQNLKLTVKTNTNELPEDCWNRNKPIKFI